MVPNELERKDILNVTKEREENMKKSIICMLGAVMCLSFVACGKGETEAQSTEMPISTEAPQESEAVQESEVVQEPEEITPNYAEIVPEQLQGVWCDAETEGVLSLYAFKDDSIETYVVNTGVGAADALSGTYTVEDGKVNYKFGRVSGYSAFTYENDVFAMFNANGTEIKKMTASDIMEYLIVEENAANRDGIICLANLIINYYADSSESSIAVEKIDAVNAAIKAEGEAALQKLTADYDKVEKLTWYEHRNQPRYTDICCYIYPYIGRMDDGYTWLRVALNYTDAQTDAGWIFFNHVIFSVDGENTTRSFSRDEIVRDNDTEVWEIADFEPDNTEIQLLLSIADSTETIIRFEGDEYYEDHIVTDKEKEAIKDVLTAYDYLSNYVEE